MSDKQLTDIKDRLDTASTYLPGGASPWLGIAHAAGAWLYDTTGARFLDFGEGSRVCVMGHGYITARDTLADQMQYYLYPGSPFDAASHAVVNYAKELSARFELVRGEPHQVLACSSVAEARQVLSHLDPAIEIRAMSADHSLDGAMVQDLVHRSRAAGKLIIADETATGFGRTGTLWAYEHLNFIPDVTLVGPTGAAGLPFAALVATAEVFSRVSGIESLTFTSPLSCAAARAVLAGITPELLENVVEMGTLLETQYAELRQQFPDKLGELTGRGLLRQVHLADDYPPQRFWLQCQFGGLILNPDLTLTPPLTVGEDEITAAIDVMADVLLEWQ